MTTSKLDQAREWAESVGKIEGLSPRTYATIKLIQSLPDRIVDGDKLRQVIDFQGTSISGYARKDLESLIPATPLPTFEDMTAEEREACQWMQAQVFATAGTPGIITNVDEYARSAIILFTDGMAKNVPWKEITPLSDLPKLEWPGGVEDAPVTDGEPTLPRPEDVPPGELWSIRYYGKEWAGVRSDSEWVPWSIISMDGQDYRDVDDSEIALMFRLVPERKENA